MNRLFDWIAETEERLFYFSIVVVILLGSLFYGAMYI